MIQNLEVDGVGVDKILGMVDNWGYLEFEKWAY